MNFVVEVKSVHKMFLVGDQKVKALEDINLQVQKAEFLALAGSSGSGKTTLLNLIGGLDQPTSGSVCVESKNLKECSDNELSDYRRVKMGFIFQSFNLMPVLNATENVEYPLLRRADLSSEQKKELAIKALEKVGLASQLTKFPNQMSGGQRQRVAIARAIVHSPSLVIADEPTANLDKKTGGEVLELMKRLNKEEGVTFIFSTHDPLIIQKAGRVISISDGRVISDTSGGQN